MIYGLCEDPRCQHSKKPRKLWLHSSELYYPDYYARTGKKYYKACSQCIDADHEAWDMSLISKKLTQLHHEEKR